MLNRPYISSILLIAAFSVCSCTTEVSGDAGEISRIEAKCGVKKGTLRLDDKTGFTFNPDPNEEYEKVDCALNEIRSSKLSRHMKYGFVGNEQYRVEEDQK